MVPFDRDEDGMMKPGEAKEARGSSETMRLARAIVPLHARPRTLRPRAARLSKIRKPSMGLASLFPPVSD